MKTVTKQQLIDWGACSDGLGRFIAQTHNTDNPVEVLSLIGGKNTTSDLLWLADRTLEKDKLIRFACGAALINIELIKPHTDDYDLIVGFLHNPDAADAARADAAARAARAAAWAARAARAATAWAARAAAWAADAAARAADAAWSADAAARAADAANAQRQVDGLLKELFA